MYFISTCITFLQELALLYKLHKVITTITILCNAHPLKIDDDNTSLPNRDITNSLILLQHCAYLRTLLLEGGSIYIKLAQWLLSNISYNSVYSVVYEQLEDLFDNCPSQTLEQSAIVYAAATGHQLSEDYDVASIRVIGSGSIGTVYYAVPLNTTPLATPVAIKIKHPQINEELEQKRTVIQCLQSMQQFSIFRRWFNMNCIDLDSFLANIYSQADFTIEAANMARMHTNFANNPSIVIPRVLWSSRDVLITEYVPTIELKEIAAGEQYLVACNLICMIYQMCLVDNFIHGDLHCKNWKLLAPLAPLDPLAPLAPLDPQSSGAMGERSHPHDNSNVQNGDKGDCTPSQQINTHPSIGESDGIRQKQPMHHKIVLFDMGICFSMPDIQLTRQLWDALENCNVYQIFDVVKKLCNVPLELTDDIDVLLRNLNFNKVDSVSMIKTIVQYFTEHNIVMHNFILNILIMICLIEKFIKQHGFMQQENNMRNIFTLIQNNRMDLLSYCTCYNSYPEVAQIIKQKLLISLPVPKYNLILPAISDYDSTDSIASSLSLSLSLSDSDSISSSMSSSVISTFTSSASSSPQISSVANDITNNATDDSAGNTADDGSDDSADDGSDDDSDDDSGDDSSDDSSDDSV